MSSPLQVLHVQTTTGMKPYQQYQAVFPTSSPQTLSSRELPMLSFFSRTHSYRICQMDLQTFWNQMDQQLILKTMIASSALTLSLASAFDRVEPWRMICTSNPDGFSEERSVGQGREGAMSPANGRRSQDLGIQRQRILR